METILPIIRNEDIIVAEKLHRNIWFLLEVIMHDEYKLNLFSPYFFQGKLYIFCMVRHHYLVWKIYLEIVGPIFNYKLEK